MKKEPIVLTKDELCECIHRIEMWLAVLREAVNNSDGKAFAVGHEESLPAYPVRASALSGGSGCPPKMKKGKK